MLYSARNNAPYSRKRNAIEEELNSEEKNSPAIILIDKADPSGAPPQSGPDDTSTAILRPKKPPDRLVIDEASNDDNSVATLDPATRETLGNFSSDTILVKGKKRKDTVLICLSSEDVDAGKIQMNKAAL